MKSVTFERALKGSKAYGILKSDSINGLGHAYMVISADNDAVEQFFTLAAATVFCKNGTACLKCEECAKVLHDNNPDVALINVEMEKIKVADVKEMLSDVDIKPLSGRKLYFVHRADLMNAEAQNKLLKTFEEPPQGVTVFLGVANESAMLDTLKSRARSLYIDSFSADEIYSALLGLGCDEQSGAVAAACGEGQLGKAYKIAQSGEYAQLYKDAFSLLSSLKRSSDVLSAGNVAALQKDTANFLDVLSIILRDMMVAKKEPELMLSKHVSAQIVPLCSAFSERALAETLFCVNDARRKLSLNLNQAATIDNLLFSILEVKHKWQL